jgi:hypothetical protein
MAKHKKPPKIVGVHTIYVKGTSEGAIRARKELQLPYDRHPDRACFVPVNTPKRADAVLEIQDEKTDTGVSVTAALPPPEASRPASEVLLKDGPLLRAVLYAVPLASVWPWRRESQCLKRAAP